MNELFYPQIKKERKPTYEPTNWVFQVKKLFLDIFLVILISLGKKSHKLLNMIDLGKVRSI